MKKILLALLVLALAVPAMATVTITCTKGTTGTTIDEVTVSFVNNDANVGKKVRAFALDVTINGATNSIATGTVISTGYWVYPGTISIDDTNGVIKSLGSPFCPGTARDAKIGLGQCGATLGGGVTVEMGSLYVGGPNAPAQSGNLFKFTVKNGGTVAVALNTTRGGIVLEDGSAPVVVSPGVVVTNGGISGVCTKCKGDVNLDGYVRTTDITALVTLLAQHGGTLKRIAWNATWYNACADLNNAGRRADGYIRTTDITAMVTYIAQAGGTLKRVTCSGVAP